MTAFRSHSQIPDKDVKDFARKMDDVGMSSTLENGIMQYLVELKDTAVANDFFYRLEKESRGKSKYFRFQMMYLKIWKESRFSPKTSLEQILASLDEYLKQAYETGEDRIIAIANWNYGLLMYRYHQMELATVYCLKGLEVIEKDKSIHDTENFLWIMGEIFFRNREFRQCIYYTSKALQHQPDSSYLFTKIDGHNMNTIGQAYYHLGKLDSALYYYTLSDQKFTSINWPLWKGINACFAGQVYFEKNDIPSARLLLQYAYAITVNKENIIAGYALCWLGRIFIAEQKTDSAVNALNEALHLLNTATPEQSLQKANYLQQLFFAKAELFRVQDRTDSFYYYTRQHTQLHDSLIQVATLSNSKIAQLRINNERNELAIHTVENEKSKVVLKRNIIITAISLAGIAVILVLYRQKRELKYKVELAHYQKQILKTEADMAREQLGLFTQNLLEKNNLLEQLQEQLSKKEFHRSQEQAIQVINELSNQTILTEQDWTRFKSLFEKNYPGFFIKLKQVVPDITVAEQRMAALSRLELTSKQMASMLGISVDSVYKTRQRLRQRINLVTEKNFDEFLATL